MSEEQRVHLTVWYNDGSVDHFSFSRRGDLVSSLSQYQQLGESPGLMIELEDRLLMIPFSSIKSMEVSPKPDPLPTLVLNNGTRVEAILGE